MRRKPKTVVKLVQEPPVDQPLDRFRKRLLIILEKERVLITRGALILAIIGMATTGILYAREHDLRNHLLAPQQQTQGDTQQLLAKISIFMVLPSDEIPTIATVTDPDKLKGQEFFANAKKGDKVIIYAKAHKAILYDPIQNKIIDVAPLSVESSPSTAPK